MISSDAHSIRIVCNEAVDGLDLQSLKTLTAKVREAEEGRFSVTVVLADDAAVRRLNLLYLRRTGTTDVIAFPGDDHEGSPGEIIVNLDEARTQASERGESLQKAVARLVVHGVLHLSGWTDDTDAAQRKMLRHGERFLTNIA
jgi:probable rRNA maturation factor